MVEIIEQTLPCRLKTKTDSYTILPPINKEEIVQNKREFTNF